MWHRFFYSLTLFFWWHLSILARCKYSFQRFFVLPKIYLQNLLKYLHYFHLFRIINLHIKIYHKVQFSFSMFLLILLLSPRESLKYLHDLHSVRIINIYICHKIQFNILLKDPSIYYCCHHGNLWFSFTFTDNFDFFTYFDWFSNFSTPRLGIIKIGQRKYRFFIYAYPINDRNINFKITESRTNLKFKTQYFWKQPQELKCIHFLIWIIVSLINLNIDFVFLLNFLIDICSS